MRFSESYSCAASAADVFAARCQPAVREAACTASGALSWTVDVREASDVTHIVVTRVLPPNVPAAFRSFIGDSINVRQQEEWTSVTDGSYQAQITVTIVGQPASMVGSSVIRADGAGSVEDTTGEVKVSIPFFGRQIEPEIAKVVAAALRQEQLAGQAWLASRPS
jgi:hypothetical protein